MSEAPAPAVPAIGYSVSANIGGDRQIVFQSFVALDDPDDKVNATLDRIMRFVDRQKAKADLPALREELEKLHTTLQRYRDDKAAVDAQFARDQAMRDLEIKTLQQQKADTLSEGATAFRTSGRQGEYKPSGQTAANVKRAETQIETVIAAKAQAAAEREVALQNLGTSEARYAEEIAKLEAKIADLQGTLKGS